MSTANAHTFAATPVVVCERGDLVELRWPPHRIFAYGHSYAPPPQTTVDELTRTLTGLNPAAVTALRNGSFATSNFPGLPVSTTRLVRREIYTFTVCEGRGPYPYNVLFLNGFWELQKIRNYQGRLPTERGIVTLYTNPNNHWEVSVRLDEDSEHSSVQSQRRGGATTTMHVGA
ncbi:hypothetical protein P389DRAFT_198131 [Cystobasidium minutum MCA 4210]|uniref:uncharacterized protein n=1 Tax=Cystobasidium minutum MCA 4210 TaxID=1397322 RepID=UPI0034D02147|eukprot:jgi/Rhomi1/198131/gm1.6345_g